MTTSSDRESSAMDRERAEALAALVRPTTAHEVPTVPDGASFAVEVRVRPQDEGEPGTYHLYDEDDWAWLEDRIGVRGFEPPDRSDPPRDVGLASRANSRLRFGAAERPPSPATGKRCPNCPGQSRSNVP